MWHPTGNLKLHNWRPKGTYQQIIKTIVQHSHEKPNEPYCDMNNVWGHLKKEVFRSWKWFHKKLQHDRTEWWETLAAQLHCINQKEQLSARTDTTMSQISRGFWSIYSRKPEPVGMETSKWTELSIKILPATRNKAIHPTTYLRQKWMVKPSQKKDETREAILLTFDSAFFKANIQRSGNKTHPTYPNLQKVTQEQYRSYKHEIPLDKKCETP